MSALSDLRVFLAGEQTISAMRETEVAIDLARVSQEGARLAEQGAQAQASRARRARAAEAAAQQKVEQQRLRIEALERELSSWQSAMDGWVLSQLAFGSLYHELGKQLGISEEERARAYCERVAKVGDEQPKYQATRLFQSCSAHLANASEAPAPAPGG
jgi:hypothetical protein